MSATFAGFFCPARESVEAAVRAEWPFLVVQTFGEGGEAVLGAAIPGPVSCVMDEGVRPYNRGETERMAFALRLALRPFSARFPKIPFVYLDMDREGEETGASGAVFRDGAELDRRDSLEPDADAATSALELLREYLGVKLGRRRSFAALKPGAFGPWPSPAAEKPPGGGP
jgi:hypothetical protein